MTIVTVLSEVRTPGKTIVLEMLNDGEYNAKPYRLTIVRRFNRQEDAEREYNDAVSSPRSRKPATEKRLPQNRRNQQRDITNI